MRCVYWTICFLLCLPLTAQASDESRTPPSQNRVDWPLGEPCTLTAPGRPHPDVYYCGQAEKICAVRVRVGAFDSRRPADLRVLYGTIQVPIVGDRDTVVRVVAWSNGTLWSRAVECPKCRGYDGYTFLGRPACMTDAQLLAFQRELGIPGDRPLRTEEAWAQALAKLPPQPAP